MSIADGELTAIAFCWRLERLDGAGLALTSHDQALVRDGIRYSPAPGMIPAAITRSLGMEPDNSEIAGALSTDALDENDLAVGRWDDARMQLSVVDWENAEAAPVRLLGGELGTVAIDGERFTADLRGAASRLEAPVCPATSAECRAELGDKRCRVDLAGRTLRAHVVATDATTIELDTAVDDRFVLGRLRYMSGGNCGLSTVVLAAAGTTVQVRDWPRAAVDPGCCIELREGCDKRLTTCATRFGNAVNFRGEPHLPGNDLLTRYPGA